MLKFAVNWSPHGINPNASRYYASYISRLCRDVYNMLKTRLDHVSDEESLSVCNTSHLHKEVLDHVAACQHRLAAKFC